MRQVNKAQSDERLMGGYGRGIGHVIVPFALTGQRILGQWNGMAVEGMDAES